MLGIKINIREKQITNFINKKGPVNVTLTTKNTE